MPVRCREAARGPAALALAGVVSLALVGCAKTDLLRSASDRTLAPSDAVRTRPAATLVRTSEQKLTRPPVLPTREPDVIAATTEVPQRRRGIEEVAVPGDRPAYVLAGERRLLVYLHGRCGDPTGFMAWADAVRPWATVVALSGDVACPQNPTRRRWEVDIEALEGRVLAAARAAGDFDEDDITLAGYSQGAARAESLAARSPDRFRRLLLISGPDAPDPDHVARSEAVALLAGERDRRRHLESAAAGLAADGFPVRFWMLPGARHGEYGPAAARVLADALAWMFADVDQP